MFDHPSTLIRIAAILAAGPPLLGFLSRRGWIFELLSHFRVQYAGVLATVGIIALLLREPGLALVLALVFAVNTRPLFPFLSRRSQSQPADDHTVVLANVRMRNREFPHLAELLRSEAPDIVGLVEVDAGWLQGLQEVEHELDYYSSSLPGDDSYGLAIFSKYRIHLQPPIDFGDLEASSLACEIDMLDRILNILILHLTPPLTPRLMWERNLALEQVAEWLASRDGDWLVMGDLNLSPWSPEVEQFCERTGLNSFRVGSGIRPTWPDHFMPLRIPLDHVFGSPQIRFGRSQVGRSVKSDHLPLIIEFSF